MATLASKTTFAVSLLACIGTIYGVHRIQALEETNMGKGIERDIARMADKKKLREARQQDFEEQVQRRHFLEKIQPVSDPLAPVPPLPPGAQVEKVDLQNCSTCDAPPR